MANKLTEINNAALVGASSSFFVDALQTLKISQESIAKLAAGFHAHQNNLTSVVQTMAKDQPEQSNKNNLSFGG